MNKKLNIAGSTILTAVALAYSVAANAQTATMAYRPYELHSQEGVKSVADRITRAASRACREGAGTSVEPRRVCVTELSRILLSKINSPVLTAQWNAERNQAQG